MSSSGARRGDGMIDGGGLSLLVVGSWLKSSGVESWGYRALPPARDAHTEVGPGSRVLVVVYGVTVDAADAAAVHRRPLPTGCRVRDAGRVLLAFGGWPHRVHDRCASTPRWLAHASRPAVTDRLGLCCPADTDRETRVTRAETGCPGGSCWSRPVVSPVASGVAIVDGRREVQIGYSVSWVYRSMSSS